MERKKGSPICNLEESGGMEEESKSKSRGERDVLISSPVLQNVRACLVLERK